MKKLLSICLLSLLFIFNLTACSNDDSKSLSEDNSLSKFEGVIAEINDTTAIITPNADQDHILSSGDKVSVNLSVSNIEFSVGDEVIVYYSGDIMESYPLQVNVSDIELLAEFKNSENQDTLSLGSYIYLNTHSEEIYQTNLIKSYDVIESEDYFFIVYTNSITEFSEECVTVVETFDKGTGELIGTTTQDGELIDDSFKYDEKNNLLQYSLISDNTPTISILNFNEVVNNYFLPQSLNGIFEGIYASSFDGTPNLSNSSPSNAWWAVTNEDGIYLEPVEGNENSTIIISSDIILDNYEFNTSEDYPMPTPYFSDVKILNGGKTIVATIVSPMSQSGNVGIYTYNLETKEENFYTDVFSAMVANVNYYNDTTIIAHGYDFATVIKLDTNEVSTLKTFEFTFYHTYDYENFFDFKIKDGKSSIAMINIDNENNEILLKEFETEINYILGITENYIVVITNDNKISAIFYEPNSF